MPKIAFPAGHLDAANQAGMLRCSGGDVYLTDAGARAFSTEQAVRRLPQPKFCYAYGVLYRCLPALLRAESGHTTTLTIFGLIRRGGHRALAASSEASQRSSPMANDLFDCRGGADATVHL